MSTLNTFHKPNARRKRAERRSRAYDHLARTNYQARTTESERSRPRKGWVYVRYADGHIERELAS